MEDLFKEAIKLNTISEKIGFKWESFTQIIEKIDSELEEIKEVIVKQEGKERLEDEIGDLLFAVVSLAYFLNVDPRKGFNHGLVKYSTRLNCVRQIIQERNLRLDLNSTYEMLLNIWNEAKARANLNGAAGED